MHHPVESYRQTERILPCPSRHESYTMLQSNHSRSEDLIMHTFIFRSNPLLQYQGEALLRPFNVCPTTVGQRLLDYARVQRSIFAISAVVQYWRNVIERSK